MTPSVFGKFDDSAYVGRPHDVVVAELKEINQGAHIVAVSSGMMVTTDHKLSRIRVRYNEKTGFVTSVRRG
jgi:hypothetical protein